MVAIEEVPPRGAAANPDPNDEEEGLGWCGTAVCGGFVLGSIFLLGLFLNRNAEPYRKLKVESFANDEVLRNPSSSCSGPPLLSGPPTLINIHQIFTNVTPTPSLGNTSRARCDTS